MLEKIVCIRNKKAKLSFWNNNVLFIKQELSLKQYVINKNLEISSTQCKDINYSKERSRNTTDTAIKKIPIANFKTHSSLLQTTAL